MSALDLVLGSSNPGKLRELRRRLGAVAVSVRLHPLDEDPEETGDTFLANALIKAEAFACASGAVALADDSGLCVDALDGGPGVYSARFAARTDSLHATSDRDRNLANNMALLDRLIDVEDRAAHFRCTLALCAPTASPFGDWLQTTELPPGIERAGNASGLVSVACSGCTHGTIVAGSSDLDAHGRLIAASGHAGFGYDPVFRSDDLGITFGEADAAQKDSVSHRGRALDLLVELFRRFAAVR